MNCAYRWCEVEETYVAARNDERPATIVVHRAVLLTTETECNRTLSVSMIASGIRPDPHGLIEISGADCAPGVVR